MKTLPILHQLQLSIVFNFFRKFDLRLFYIHLSSSDLALIDLELLTSGPLYFHNFSSVSNANGSPKLVLRISDRTIMFLGPPDCLEDINQLTLKLFFHWLFSEHISSISLWCTVVYCPIIHYILHDYRICHYVP